MKLKLVRDEFTDEVTLGKLYIDGEYVCETLEDRDRKLEDDITDKVYAKSAIPRGKYEVIVNYSPRFKRELPLLVDVPGFTGIRIHTGNTHENTEGCILVGMLRRGSTVLQSRIAFSKVFQALESAYDRGLTISIEMV